MPVTENFDRRACRFGRRIGDERRIRRDRVVNRVEQAYEDQRAGDIVAQAEHAAGENIETMPAGAKGRTLGGGWWRGSRCAPGGTAGGDGTHAYRVGAARAAASAEESEVWDFSQTSAAAGSLVRHSARWLVSAVDRRAGSLILV